jgi:hypothetical protein
MRESIKGLFSLKSRDVCFTHCILPVGNFSVMVPFYKTIFLQQQLYPLIVPQLP